MLSMLQTMLPNRGMKQHLLPNSLRGVKVLITGCTNGLGYATAEKFAQYGAHLIVAGRDQAKCLQLIENVKKYYPTSTSCSNQTAQQQATREECEELEYYPLDLSSFDSIRQFAQSYQSKHNELHVLVCNAGVLVPEKKLSVDGHELTFATNHLGHFLLTNLLMPCLRRAAAIAPQSNVSNESDTQYESASSLSSSNSLFGASRIVVVSSVMHTTGSLHNILNDPNIEARSYSSVGSTEYADSKLANLLFAYELNRRLKENNENINVYAVHPGTMATGLFNEMNNGAMGYIMNPIKNVFFTDPSVCAEAIFRIAASSSFASASGLYYSGVNEISSSRDSLNEEAQRKLWNYSEIVCQLNSENYLSKL